jgi:hypothetical protein
MGARRPLGRFPWQHVRSLMGPLGEVGNDEVIKTRRHIQE